jgi:hypothetical protein
MVAAPDPGAKQNIQHRTAALEHYVTRTQAHIGTVSSSSSSSRCLKWQATAVQLPTVQFILGRVRAV